MALLLPRAFLVALPLLFAACSPADDAAADASGAAAGDAAGDAVPAPAAANASEDAVAALRAAIASLAASPEHSDDEIELQHILIAFQGAQRATVTRSKEQAEALTAELFERAKKGADFTALMKQHSTDSGPGIYPMTLKGRSGMVAGFGNVGWRLQPGMIGVAPYDPTASPYGWHIIKRLK